jgi:hypothetical protein
MKTVVNAILILLVCLGCIAGGLAIGEKRWKDAAQKVLAKGAKENAELVKQNDELKYKLNHERQLYNMCNSEYAQLTMKYAYIDSLDTNGISCREVVEHQRKNYEARMSEYDLHWKWERRKIKKMDELINFTYKYFKQTQDSTAWKLLMDLRDPCDKKAGKQI